MEPHIRSTLRRMSAQPVALCLQDTTTLDFNGQDIKGLGSLQYEAQCGLLLYPTCVVTASREPLGLLDSWHWARDLYDANGERPGQVSESERWVEVYERSAELPDARCVSVGDREADMVALIRRAKKLDHPADWLVRAKHDRALPDGRKLFQSVLDDKLLGQVSFHFRPRRRDKARDVVPQLHVERVTVKDSNKGTLKCTCVIVREVDVANAVQRVEWRLMTSRGSSAVPPRPLNWYRARWKIGMYFDVLKNG